jgi:hypothetical protein
MKEINISATRLSLEAQLNQPVALAVCRSPIAPTAIVAVDFLL